MNEPDTIDYREFTPAELQAIHDGRNGYRFHLFYAEGFNGSTGDLSRFGKKIQSYKQANTSNKKIL